MTTEQDKKFLKLALIAATGSRDRSTQVGCVIVSPEGEVLVIECNNMPEGVDETIEARHERPEKYHWAEHAERNAFFKAAKLGIALDGCTLYVTSIPTKFPPCAECARGAVQTGIIRVVQEPPEGDFERWKASCERAMTILGGKGIVYDTVSLA